MTMGYLPRICASVVGKELASLVEIKNCGQVLATLLFDAPEIRNVAATN